MKCPDQPATPLTPRERFSVRLGIPISHVEHIVELARLIHRCGEKEHNGDRHKASKHPGDKNGNAMHWGAQRERHIDALIRFVAGLNCKVWLNGLRPSLTDENGTFVEIPE